MNNDRKKVALLQEDGSLLLTQRKKYLLEELVAKMAPENIHSEISTGLVVGTERLED